MRLLLAFLGAAMVLSSYGEIPGGKAGKRISQIENDFASKFINVIRVSVSGKPVNYWGFVKLDSDLTFKGFAYVVPVGATDQQVTDCITSSIAATNFYEAMIKRLKDSAPSPVPSPTPTGNSDSITPL